jgi:hypothetical protein
VRPAPFGPGDWITVEHHEDGGLCTEAHRVDRVVKLNSGNEWRVEVTRNDGTPMHVIVDRYGHERKP